MRAVAAVCVLVAAACGRVGFDPATQPIGTGGDGGTTTDAHSPGDGQLPANTNVAFITSMELRPDQIIGLTGADGLCNHLAASTGLPNPGTYVAWLSTGGTTAPARLGSSRGWVRTDGRPFVDTVSDLVAGKMFYPLSVDETAASQPPGSPVLTATTSTGTYSGSDCSDYTSTTGAVVTGIATYTTTFWTEWSTITQCAGTYHLYCFGTGQTTPVHPPASTASSRLAFLSAIAWPSGGGLGNADNLCQSDATAAGLPGTYRALLASIGTTAIARFDVSKAVWTRVDGAALAASTADFENGNTLTALNVTAKGTFVAPGAPVVWTGGAPNATGTAPTTCDGWTTSASGTSGGGGNIVATGPEMFVEQPALACSISTAHVYCLQQ